ncbi:hypothetical protein I7I50_11835 [Histoplasma capsulatum G186AR]|uniref:Uncharacterized protein n=1 Tax=Ajellomyces capsulatus TaxID=5037 RepID=A0A8H8D7P4_AJECA|nr:hypothetical protein I7I52_03073 [Histoplasma capsulatum]QSS70264.1 hypothetical protein I7I50_11835 [Histoplasma capsulatum G186AR]
MGSFFLSFFFGEGMWGVQSIDNVRGSKSGRGEERKTGKSRGIGIGIDMKGCGGVCTCVHACVRAWYQEADDELKMGRKEKEKRKRGKEKRDGEVREVEKEERVKGVLEWREEMEGEVGG